MDGQINEGRNKGKERYKEKELREQEENKMRISVTRRPVCICSLH
jgi:hypothetical protein